MDKGEDSDATVVYPPVPEGETDSDATQDYPENMSIFERMAETAIGGPTDVPMDATQAPDPERDVGWTGQKPRGHLAVTTPSESSGRSHVVGEVAVELGLGGHLKKFAS